MPLNCRNSQFFVNCCFWLFLVKLFRKIFLLMMWWNFSWILLRIPRIHRSIWDHFLLLCFACFSLVFQFFQTKITKNYYDIYKNSVCLGFSVACGVFSLQTHFSRRQRSLVAWDFQLQFAMKITCCLLSIKFVIKLKWENRKKRLVIWKIINF